MLLEWEVLFQDNFVNRSGKIRTKLSPHGVLMNFLARKTFSLEYRRQCSQQGIVIRSTSQYSQCSNLQQSVAVRAAAPAGAAEEEEALPLPQALSTSLEPSCWPRPEVFMDILQYSDKYLTIQSSTGYSL